MMKTRIILNFFAICIAFMLAGCTQGPWLYRVNVQQGNVITSDLAHRLRVGMTKEAVCEILGPPVLVDTFNDKRWTYTYTFKPGRGKCVERSLTVYFKNNRVSGLKTRNI